MIRILLFLFVVFCLGLGFAWLADRPGDLVMTFNGYQYHVTLMVAAVAGVVVVAAMMIGWWLIKSIWNSPRAVNRYFRARRRDRGYQSLSTGLIAAGAGDIGLARKMDKQASGLLSGDQEPLLHLLDAQTMLLEGRHDEARAKFERMVDDPETRLLGLRGLYLEAQRLGEREAARHYAEQAAETAPQLTWASNSAIETRTLQGDWDGALKLVESQASTSQITKDEANRRRAVLLTARAEALIDANPQGARAAALEASKLMPDFVPAAVAAGRALFRQNELRKGTRLLEAIWKKAPHPEVADVYVHARPGDSTQDRLKRARRLETLKRNHVESSLAVARAANDAGEYRVAREAIETALRLGPRESAYLLLADIEENETGDQGRVRHWLSKAVRAPRDPAWTADGYVSETWAPVSPITGALGAFEWKVPVERLGTVIDAGDDDAAEIPIIPEPAVEPGIVEETVEEPVDVEVIGREATEPAAAGATAETAQDGDGASANAEDAVEAEDVAAEKPAEAEPVAATAEADGEAKTQETDERKEEPDGAAGEAGKAGKAGEDEAVVPFPPIPDDPGVDEEDVDKQQPSRFRLF
ncbi:MAG: heme biosynthesis protein HemY [Rhizobiaceae bacterium]